MSKKDLIDTMERNKQVFKGHKAQTLDRRIKHIEVKEVIITVRG